MVERLVQLLVTRGVDSAPAEPLARLLDLLAADTRSLSTIRNPKAAVDGHVADALDGIAVPQVRDAREVLDVGAGAGFPGLVLATVLPEAQVVLMDAVGKKAAFIAEAIDALGLRNAEAVHARAEEWPEGHDRFDVVTARAVAPLSVLVEYAAPLLREGGVLVAYKGRRDPAEEADAAAAAAQTGMALAGVVAAAPRSGADERHLHVATKVAPTPPRFPRRPGMARKRPLTAQELARKTR